MKKRNVEPYVHQSIKEVFEMFGADEAEKKVQFVKFWEQADTSKDWQELVLDFQKYINALNEATTISDIDKTKAALNKLSPLVANKILEQLDSKEVRELIGVKGEKKDKPVEGFNRFG